MNVPRDARRRVPPECGGYGPSKFLGGIADPVLEEKMEFVIERARSLLGVELEFPEPDSF